MSRIYLSPPEVGDEERRMLLDAFDSNWIAPLGPDVDAFEARAGRSGRRRPCGGPLQRHGRPPSGPAADRRRAGDEVLVPSFTFVATANAVSYLGATPVFVDCSPATWNIDPDLVAEELAARAAAGPTSRPPSSPSTSTASAPTTTP